MIGIPKLINQGNNSFILETKLEKNKDKDYCIKYVPHYESNQINDNSYYQTC